MREDNALDAYLPVPVKIAAQISHNYAKAWCIVLSYDAKHDRLHTTTFGIQAEDKQRAAELGEVAAKAIGADLERKETYEDFRLDAARLKEENDRLRTENASLKEQSQ